MPLTPDHFRREVIFKAVRSRGPGGQNVNKVSSAAHLSWDYAYSNLLSDQGKERIRDKLANLINVDGQLVMRSDEFRDLERNKSRCLEKLAEAVARALFVPKKRKKTKPTKASQVRRRDAKSRRGQIKKLRSRPDF